MPPAKGSPAIFNKDRAASYDQQRAKMAPMKDALHLFTRLVLSDLPDEAHILCVGIGTGAEMFDLADAYPQWRFTAVDPAAAMLDVCRRKAEERDIASRCTFHEGYLSSLPPTDGFDGATSFLVSHFLTQPDKRRGYFAEIGARLRKGGLLVNADISGDMTAPNFQSLLDVWLRMLKYSDLPAEEITKMQTSLGEKVAVLPPREIESLIKSSGFTPPVLFFQSLLIHAWYADWPGS
jgi:tRNA (cmo5U34)-methyltransferase